MRGLHIPPGQMSACCGQLEAKGRQGPFSREAAASSRSSGWGTSAEEVFSALAFTCEPVSMTPSPKHSDGHPRITADGGLHPCCERECCADDCFPQADRQQLRPCPNLHSSGEPAGLMLKRWNVWRAKNHTTLLRNRLTAQIDARETDVAVSLTQGRTRAQYKRDVLAHGGHLPHSQDGSCAVSKGLACF